MNKFISITPINGCSLCKIFFFKGTKNYSKKSSSVSSESFLNGTSIKYIEELYTDWMADATSVHPSWDLYFRGADHEVTSSITNNPGLSSKKLNPTKLEINFGTGPEKMTDYSLTHHQIIHSIIRSYQARGHLIAKVNPLEAEYDEFHKMPIEESFRRRSNVFHLYNIVDFPLDAQIQLPKNTYVGGEETTLTARELFRRLEHAYCRYIGVEYMHLNDLKEREWVRSMFEPPGCVVASKKEKRRMLERLGKSTWLEDYFMTKFPNEKRFGAEGGEIAIPSLQFIIDQSVAEGVDTIIMGMAHRGRLNVIANIVRVPLKQIFTFFVDLDAEDSKCGDIKYHMGAYSERQDKLTGKNITISLQPNPSHLACVYPVTVGRARGGMHLIGDQKGEKVLPIVMHGDAALSGQGCGYETIQLSHLENHGTHGVIHLVLNNQLGFTAEPSEYKSSRYCTDLAKVVDAPVFHVNSDDPESVIYVSKVAAQWRAKFHKDVIIDLVSYRRLGHSEDDNPNFTSPTLYKKIAKMTKNFDKFSANCIKEELDRIFKARQELFKKKICNWPMAEAVAIGSLLKEGIHVRISGEDVARGTFAHRHHILHDTEVEKKTYTYFNDLYPTQARYTIANSVLSEYGVLGFEHGFSTTTCNFLTIWEAQYGDFVNTAQVILDQFVSSGDEKWKRPCGLVVSLPHGLEGGGPEHSSARIERYLLLCNDDPDYLPPITSDLPMKQLKTCNWILANCSTPANYFHILRRQIALPFRRPLLLFMPKSLLRDPRVRSPFKDFLEESEFKRLIPDTGPASSKPDKIRKLIFCSGKVYFFIIERLKEEKCLDKIAVTRIEQLAPFPYDLVIKECAKYPKAQIIWAQEEHKNSGCWEYMKNRLETSLKGERDILYIGRPISTTPATGFRKLHNQQIEKFLSDITKFCKN